MSQAPSGAAAEAKETETKQEEMQTIKLTPVQVPLQTVVGNGKAQQAAQRLQTEAEATHARCLSLSVAQVQGSRYAPVSPFPSFAYLCLSMLPNLCLI